MISILDEDVVEMEEMSEEEGVEALGLVEIEMGEPESKMIELVFAAGGARFGEGVWDMF